MTQSDTLPKASPSGTGRTGVFTSLELRRVPAGRGVDERAQSGGTHRHRLGVRPSIRRERPDAAVADEPRILPPATSTLQQSVARS